MRTLWQAIRNWFRGKGKDLEGVLANDVRDAAFAIEDARAELNRLIANVRDLLAVTFDQQKQSDSKAQQAEEYQTVALRAAAAAALARSEEDHEKETTARSDVEAALAAKGQREQEVRVLNQEIDSSRKVLVAMKEQIDRLRGKIRHAESLQVQLAARKAGAGIRQQMAEAVLGLSSTSGLGRLGDLEAKVAHGESVAEATEQMAGETDEATHEALLRRYGTETEEVKAAAEQMIADAAQAEEASV